MKLYIRAGLFLIFLFWFTGSLLPFLLVLYPPAAKILPFLNLLYSPVCHQIGAKLFCIDNACSLVCSRCLGIYGGVMISSFLMMILKPEKFYPVKYLVYSSVPMIIDVILTSINLIEYSPTRGVITGFIFGCSAFYYFYKGIYSIVVEKKVIKEIN